MQMRVGKDLYINYDCAITYKEGKHRNLSLASVKATREEYRAIAAGADSSHPPGEYGHV